MISKEPQNGQFWFQVFLISSKAQLQGPQKTFMRFNCSIACPWGMGSQFQIMRRGPRSRLFLGAPSCCLRPCVLQVYCIVNISPHASVLSRPAPSRLSRGTGRDGFFQRTTGLQQPCMQMCFCDLVYDSFIV